MAERAVVSLSGGLDSCVAVAMAQAEGFDLALLHADYGQLTERRERQAFEAIADHYAVPPQRRLIISFENLRKIGGSALTDPNIPLPEGDLHREGVPVSYVPFRNAHLLATAVSWAEVLQEQALLARSAPVKADVLLVPHHGSKTSSSPAFLDAVQPRTALVQAGYRNRFGHPAPEVLQRYAQRQVPVVESARCGAAIWSSARPDVVECERDKGRRYWQHTVP